MFRASDSPYDALHASGTFDGALAGVLGGMTGGVGGGLAMTNGGRGAGNYLGGVIGTGGLGTSGELFGRGKRGYGTSAGGSLHDGRHHGPIVHIEAISARGSLSKEIISRIIHLHTNEVRFCYEQQLIARPDLQGRMAVKFIIAADGAVSAAASASSELHDAAVEQCVLQAVKRWTFPGPDGGGIVVVTYPFVFSQAD
jgi:TonB family protein